MKIERYRGHVIGWRTRSGRRFLIDALTARAIRLSKRGDVPTGRLRRYVERVVRRQAARATAADRRWRDLR